MEHQQVIFTNQTTATLVSLVEQMNPSGVFILTDENVDSVLGQLPEQWQKIVIPAGDVNKNLDSLSLVWSALQKGGATRRSLLVNAGGGVVTDLGGFAAATFKRGMRFVNVPTTLLSAVDAAVGGKTGVNFNGLKNEIGVFREADAVVISTRYFGTLPETELKSGYAEMLKHGLIDGRQAYDKLLDYHFDDVAGGGLLRLVEESVGVKRRIVEQDPLEQGLRRALNLGHTVGHAFETTAMRRRQPVPHGYAVAWGMVVELVLSHTERSFPSSELYRLADYVLRHYGAFHITCDDYPSLIDLMRHDKKSVGGELNFTLLHDVGEVETGCIVDQKQVEAALDIYRDLMHI